MIITRDSVVCCFIFFVFINEPFSHERWFSSVKCRRLLTEWPSFYELETLMLGVQFIVFFRFKLVGSGIRVVWSCPVGCLLDIVVYLKILAKLDHSGFGSGVVCKCFVDVV